MAFEISVSATVSLCENAGTPKEPESPSRNLRLIHMQRTECGSPPRPSVPLSPEGT